MSVAATRVVVAGTGDGAATAAYQRFLAEEGVETTRADSAADLLSRLATASYDLLLLDLGLAALGPMELLEGIRNRYPDLDIVAIVPEEQERLGGESLKRGALEYLVHPASRDELLRVVRRLVERRQIYQDRARMEAEARSQGRRATALRRVLKAFSKLDRDQFLDEILRIAVEESGAQGGTVWIAARDPDRFLVVTFRGLTAPEDRAHLDRRERPLPARLVRGEACFGESDDGGTRGEDRRVIFAPIKGPAGLAGLVKINDKIGEREFTQGDLSLVESVVDSAGIGLSNAGRFDKLERKLLRDTEVPAYSLNYFVDYAAKELYKARRYRRAFSMVTIKVDNYHLIEEQQGHGGVADLVRMLAVEVNAVIRDSDVLTRVDDDEYFLLLPETGYLGSLMCVERVLSRLRRSGELAPQSGHAPMALSIGSAAFPRDGTDYDQLLVACKLRAEEARNSLFRRLHLEELDFWDIAGVLLEQPDDPAEQAPSRKRRGSSLGSTAARSCHFGSGGPEFELLQEEVGLELARNPALSGILFLGVERIDEDLPFLTHYPDFEGTSMKAYLLGRRGVRNWRFSSVTPVAVPEVEAEARNCHFLLYLSESGAYGYLVARGETHHGFHTSDSLLVEQMIAKLQEHYRLQRQY